MYELVCAVCLCVKRVHTSLSYTNECEFCVCIARGQQWMMMSHCHSGAPSRSISCFGGLPCLVLRFAATPGPARVFEGEEAMLEALEKDSASFKVRVTMTVLYSNTVHVSCHYDSEVTLCSSIGLLMRVYVLGKPGNRKPRPRFGPKCTVLLARTVCMYCVLLCRDALW